MPTSIAIFFVPFAY